MRKTKDAELDVLKARNRVAGKAAPAVERYFARSARMPKLGFGCRAWEPWPTLALGGLVVFTLLVLGIGGLAVWIYTRRGPTTHPAQ